MKRTRWLVKPHNGLWELHPPDECKPWSTRWPLLFHNLSNAMNLACELECLR
jgi:hypothetical protein